MATRWRRRGIIRQLSALLEAGEEPTVMERLGLGGWWVLSDRALYLLGRRGEPRRLPIAEIRSVRITPGSSTSQVTITSTAGDAVIGDVRRDGELARRLRDLPRPASGS